MLLMSAVFAVLYFPFLSKEYLYAYADIGSDTCTTYLPNIIFDIRNLLSGNYGIYSLQRGLGEFYPCYFYKYLSIFNLPLLLLGTQHIHWGLLVSTYIKYVCICVFSLLFFRRLIRSNQVAVICSLLWTFSSYTVLWGQHYQFLTYMAALSISLYGLQLYLENDRKRFLLIPSLAILAYTSYLFFYISCFFYAVYSILYLVFQKKPISDVLKKVGLLVLALFFAAALAGEYIVPSINTFLQSARTGDLSNVTTATLFYSAKTILTFLARLISNNILGTGDDFTGSFNYYEAAMLSVSILFIFSLVLLLQGKMRVKIAAITVGCCVLLCMPMASHLLTFNAEGQRWSYLLCIGEIILIAYALYQISCMWKSSAFQKKMQRTILITDGIYLGCLTLLWLAQHVVPIDFKARAAVLICAVLALYNIFFFFCPLLLRQGKTRLSWALLAGLICLEMVVCNYDSINLRDRISTQSWYVDMYNDATTEALNSVVEQNGLYRVNKTYFSVSENDSLVQEYNGLSVYSSVNSADLVNLYTTVFGNELYNSSTNLISFTGRDQISNSLLGVKYVITCPETQLDSDFYTLVSTSESYCLYENKYWLGFGYLYTQKMDEQHFLNLDEHTRALVLTDVYFDTESTNTVQYTASEINDDVETTELNGYIRSFDLLDYLKKTEGCSVEVQNGELMISATGEDPRLYFDISDLSDDLSAYFVRFEFSGENSTTVQLFYSGESEEFNETNSSIAAYDSEGNDNVISLSVDTGTKELRLDPSTDQQNTKISSIRLYCLNNAAVQTSLSQLQGNCITDFAQDGNTFSGTISNPNENAMLCIPLLYSNQWTARVDDRPVEIHNINGGLIGIPLSEGDHEISLIYHDNTQQIGRCIGVCTFLGYVVGSIIWWRKRGSREVAFRLKR